MEQIAYLLIGLWFVNRLFWYVLKLISYRGELKYLNDGKPKAYKPKIQRPKFF